MADKRMFSKKLVDTDMFLDMPATARLLYYDLAMRADDDGFVGSPRGIMRSTGATNDDMNILLMRRFVLSFDTGVIVIRHWRLHNYIQKDRYKPTTYTNEMAMLSADDKGVYELDTKCIQPVSKPCPQVRDRLEIGQDRERIEIGQVNISAHPEVSEVVVETPFDTFWREYPKKTGKGDARKKFATALTKTSFQTLMNALEQVKLSPQWNRDAGRYIPNPATWLNQERWEDEGTQIDDNANLRMLYELTKED